MSPEHEEDGRLAPVVPLFGGSVPAAPVRPSDIEADAGRGAEPDEWHTTWHAGDAPPQADGDDGAVGEAAAAGEVRLLRALGSRQLSEREARDRLQKEGLDALAIDDVIDRLTRTGALDDARLAEQLVHAAVSRRGQGRRAIAQSLQKRGVAREAIDAAIAELPDDDAERALEFARGKATNLARLDPDTALRRLVGQLARRGFGGSLGMSVARQALDEARRGSSGGVRFV